MAAAPEQSCPFAYPSRLEGQVAFDLLLDRLENLRLADETVTHIPNLNQRAPAAVDIGFDLA